MQLSDATSENSGYAAEFSQLSDTNFGISQRVICCVAELSFLLYTFDACFQCLGTIAASYSKISVMAFTLENNKLSVLANSFVCYIH